MNAWKVVYTKQAEYDLREIFEYIAFTLLEPEIAGKQIRRIINAVMKLDQMPLRYPLYEKEPWYSKGLRIFPVDHFLAFYMPVDSRKTVVVIRIMYGGRNIEERLFYPALDK